MEQNNTNEPKEIKPIAIPGIHEKFYKYLISNLSNKNLKILDIGAGHGYLVKKLFDDGYDVSASDLFPEYYYFDKVECKKADITQKLPFEDKSFDVVIAVEVMEHIHDHSSFFSETHRILKDNGFLIFTTPNILSLKSRFRFLYSGFFYSFSPLDHSKNDGLQHLASLTVDQYTNIGIKNNFKNIEIEIDKKQSTSKILLFLVPMMKIYCWLKKIDYKVHNQIKFLTGRILFFKFMK